MMVYLVGAGIFLIVLERIFPDQPLSPVKGWWTRVIVINLFQMGIVWIGGLTWDRWFQQYSFFHLKNYLPLFPSAIVAYFVLTLVYYGWHRIRHESNFLWNVFHQLHHSASRIETITSFYKHPFEIVANALLIGTVIYVLLGISVEAGVLVTLLTCLAEYFYHMNIKTPHWVGYFIQRPEMHRIHHKRGHHYQNFADLPLWDMIFGTYSNPLRCDTPCGFKPEREQKFLEMLSFQNVNNARKK